MSKLSQIQDILRSATIAEVHEFVKHFNIDTDISGISRMIGEKDDSIVLTPINRPKGFKVVLYQNDTDKPFPKFPAIRIVREFTGMFLRDSKNHVENFVNGNEIPVGEPFIHRDMAQSFCELVYLFDNKYANRHGLLLDVREV